MGEKRRHIEETAKHVAAVLRSGGHGSKFLEAMADVTEFGAVLHGDSVECLEMLVDADNQPMRRHFVRALFASFEGMTFGMKRACLAAIGETQVKYAPEEIAILRERAYDLADNGDIRERDAKLRFFPNVLFTATMFKRAVGSTHDVTVSRATRQNIERSIKLRDRLTHPKRIADLDIRLDEIEVARAIHDWFWGWVNGILTKPSFKLDPMFVARQVVAARQKR